jgi:FKBP-type peptidyl-prolyl cis-trans isomerase 2
VDRAEYNHDGGLYVRTQLERGREALGGEGGIRLALRRFPDAESAFTIIDVSEGQAKLDFNHPLAGKTLNFSATVRDVRSAGGGQIILPGEP